MGPLVREEIERVCEAAEARADAAEDMEEQVAYNELADSCSKVLGLLMQERAKAGVGA